MDESMPDNQESILHAEHTEEQENNNNIIVNKVG
jgi:hypothetical protein